ncbi:outer membrane lipoprotein chaperone LolA [Psychromonas ossibalaenae]|uniref:outer membrane lipoprotein chaperone LolA n=1 Tax=Psychromonas ossibalaenae TaxID=444922 RepID=UPI0003680B34|nr:outer membrane lipoprotein chaperone LolA [Psychromonas ossibalaenae]
MKKIISLLFILLTLPQTVSAASDAQLLKEKLAKFSVINAEFSQKIISPEGKLLNESKGQLTISRPGKFHWQVQTPEEELIVSDGKTMWYYTPFVEQVSIINLSDAIEGTPFVLLSGANKQQWADYSVKKDKNNFTVKDNKQQEQETTFVFEFNASDNVSKFVVIDAQEQRSEFELTHQPLSKKLETDYFTFTIPDGVEIDDQR